MARSPAKGLDGFLRVVVAIGKARLGKRSATMKAVLVAIAAHANADGSGARPGIRTLAACAGLTPDATLAALERLEAAGVVKVVRSRGGRKWTNRYTVILAALEATIPARETFGEDERFTAPADTTNDQGGRTPRSMASNANVRLGGTNHHHPSEPTIKTPMHPIGEAEVVAGGMDGMDGRTAEGARGELLDALRRAGVKGPNRERLADCPTLTPAIVENAVREVQSDPQVASLGAVVAARLAKTVGIDIKTSRRNSLKPELKTTVGRIAAMRRNRFPAR